MAADTGRYFGIGLDVSKLIKDAEKAKAAFDSIGEEALKQGKAIDNAFKGISSKEFQKFREGFGAGLSDQIAGTMKSLEAQGVQLFGSLSKEAQGYIAKMQEAQAALANVDKYQSALNEAYEEGRISLQDYTQASARMYVLREEITKSLAENEQALKRNTVQMDISEDSIVSMQAKVALLTTEYMKLSEAQRNSAQGEALLKQMSDLQTRLDAAQASMQRFGGAANAQFNMLGMSMQQIVRELPSLAMSPQMFFLAISNNLPVFTDAIAQARKEYKMLTDAGKTATPVWKQIVSSLLSWQTALSALPAILLVLGPQITKFFQSFFTGKEKIEDVKTALHNLNEELKNSNANYGENVVSLKRLERQWRELTDDSSKTEWIKNNKAEFDKLGISITDVADAENVFVENTSSVIESFKLRAQAAAAQRLAEEQYAKQFELEMKAQEEGRKAREQRASNDIPWWYGQGSSQSPYNRQSAQQMNEEIARGMEKNVKAIEEEAKQVGALADAYFDLKTQREDAADELLRMSNIEKSGKNDTDSRTKKQKDLWVKVPDEEVTLITPEEIQKNIDLHREMMDKFLADYGTYQQKREAIADMYALKIAQAETEGERLSLQKQMESALRELDFEEFKGSINFADIFGNLDEQTTDALRVLRDKLASYINQAAKDLRPEDLKELQDAFSKLDLKIAERDPWEEMKSALQEYRDALREVNEAKEESVNKTESQAKAEGKLQAAEQKRMKALSKLTIATNSLGEQGVQVVNMGNQLVDMLSSFGVEVPEAVSGALDGLGQVMNGLANLDFSKPFSIITSAVSVFTGLGKTIGSLFGIGGADYSGYEEMKSQYEALLSIWDDLIAKKKEYINISYGAEAIKAAEEVQQMLDTELRTYRQLVDQLLASGAGIGSHSIARRIEKRMTAEDWARVSGLVGTKLSGDAYDLFDLDPSVIGNVLNDEKLLSVLNEVAPKLVEYIQNIASYEEGVNEVTDALKESLTGVSFDEFQNSFADMMSDLDATNEDFADNLEKYLQKAIFSSLVANQYKSRIQKLYNQWSDYAESGNSLTSDEADKIRQEYNQIVNDMLADRNQIMETMGWQAESSSQQQQASRGYSITASQESIDETNGRLTGIQMGVEEMKNQITIGNVNLEEIKNHAAETRDIIQSCYSELVEIRDNTGAIVKPIQTMQKDIAEMKNDIKNKI